MHVAFHLHKEQENNYFLDMLGSGNKLFKRSQISSSALVSCVVTIYSQCLSQYVSPEKKTLAALKSIIKKKTKKKSRELL